MTHIDVLGNGVPSHPELQGGTWQRFGHRVSHLAQGARGNAAGMDGQPQRDSAPGRCAAGRGHRRAHLPCGAAPLPAAIPGPPVGRPLPAPHAPRQIRSRPPSGGGHATGKILVIVSYSSCQKRQGAYAAKQQIKRGKG